MHTRIIPCLWFDHQGEEAARFYTSLFKQGKMGAIVPYPEGGMMPAGQVMTVKFELAGQEFVALNGGPYFNFTPAISMFVGCESVDEMDTLWEQLAEGGTILMAPAALPPFFEKFGLLEDRYGMSWQLGVCGIPQYINPFFLFGGEQYGKVEEAIGLYTSIFRPSEVKEIVRRRKDAPDGKAGTVQHAQVTLGDVCFMAMDSALDHPFVPTGAVSFYVYCQSQEEIDYYWDAFSATGSQGNCGWMKDPYGIYWQIIPESLDRMMEQADSATAKRILDALQGMETKLDMDTLQKAYDNSV